MKNGVRIVFLLLSDNHHLPFTMESIGYHCDDRKVHRQRGYPFYHWIQTVEGAGEFEVGSKKFILPKDHGVLLTPHQMHAYRKCPDTQWHMQYVTFGGTQVDAVLKSLNIRQNFPYEIEPGSPLSHFVKQTISKINHDCILLDVDRSTLIYDLFVNIHKYSAMPMKQVHTERHSSKCERLNRLVTWLNTHYEEPSISLNQMAEVVHISPQYLSKLFKEAFALTPYAYLIQLRIEKAQEILLTEGDINIDEIAHRVGFYYTSHFISTFRRVVGSTPNQFRRDNVILRAK